MVKAILITGIHDVKIFKKNTTFEGLIELSTCKEINYI